MGVLGLADRRHDLRAGDGGLREQHLPYTSQEHDHNEPVPLLSPEEVAAYDSDLIRICSSSPPIQPHALLPTPHDDLHAQLPDHGGRPAHLPRASRTTRSSSTASEFVESEVEVDYQNLHPLLRRASVPRNGRRGPALVDRQPACASERLLMRAPSSIVARLPRWSLPRRSRPARRSPPSRARDGAGRDGPRSATRPGRDGTGGRGTPRRRRGPPGPRPRGAAGRTPAPRPRRRRPCRRRAAPAMPTVAVAPPAGALREPAPRPVTDVRVQSRFATKAKNAQLFGGGRIPVAGRLLQQPRRARRRHVLPAGVDRRRAAGRRTTGAR